MRSEDNNDLKIEKGFLLVIFIGYQTQIFLLVISRFGLFVLFWSVFMVVCHFRAVVHGFFVVVNHFKVGVSHFLMVVNHFWAVVNGFLGGINFFW
jgi:hypothetical protein